VDQTRLCTWFVAISTDYCYYIVTSEEITMGRMTLGTPTQSYQDLKYAPEVGVSTFVPNDAVKPSFSIVEHSEVVFKPVFQIEPVEQQIEKPVFTIHESQITIEKPVFTIHESHIAVEKPNFVTYESHLGLKADWTLRILLGISILANIWHTLR
jgi:hypothetical protein